MEHLAVGQRVDAYVVTGVLGQGGMGAVFQVERDGVRYAMKAALPDLDDGGQAARRLAREANVLQLLEHPNIVRAVDQLVTGGRLYLVLELVEGTPLDRLCDGGALAPRRALVLARQILDGVEHAHARGVVHRDLKPGNVIVARAGAPDDPYERVKLLDFGLVKLLDDAAALIGGERLTRTGMAYGTPAYIAPESALGRGVDGRADLYAVGVIAFEMLTGRTPFVATDAIKLLKAHVGTPPPRLADVTGGAPWCTPALEALCAGALAKRPDDRFADAATMRACLDEAFLSLDQSSSS
ncbi:MAG TPA: serine/threonine-protein kinase [Kofleriaceae bacterium]|jgi:serine/threonine-protein kinase|nr:serine/threonine-protein kinase [Kofleriaceae bacterium]